MNNRKRYLVNAEPNRSGQSERRSNVRNVKQVAVLLPWTLVCLCGLLLAGCATARHPGPLGGVGDFIEDNPIGKFILIAALVAAGGMFSGSKK